MRHLLAFLALGALLFVGKRAVEAHFAEPPALWVNVSAAATEAEVERAIDEAIYLDLALASPSALVDPVVREQLLRAMRPSERASETQDERDHTLLEHALAMGVHRVDPVVRQRLVFQAQQVLRAKLSLPTPSDRELSDYLAAHSERYREPARLSFTQVFLSRTRRGATLNEDARVLGERLLREAPSPEAARMLSDPTLLPSELSDASAEDIDARFGPGFSRALSKAPDARFSGPISSSYGLHFVFISQRAPGLLPPLGQVRARVLADFAHDAQERALKSALRARREGYRIVVRREGT